MPPVPRQQRQFRQACDNCRVRKTRCDRTTPCSMCAGQSITCRYNDVLDRKGRKHGRGRLISQLREAMREQSTHDHDHDSTHHDQSQSFTGIIMPNSPTGRPEPQESVPGFDAADSQFCADLPPPNILPSVAADTPNEISQHGGRLLPTTLLAHIHVFLKHLFPIMPIVNAEELLRDGNRPESLSAPRYVSIAALCAATHIQLKLDGVESVAEVENPTATDTIARFTDEFILSCALKAREQYDIIEDSGIDSLLSSFFLFAAYGNLDKQKHAWFYLSQCLSQSNALGLHNESTYSGLDPVDAEMRRRIFWILFVTERTYALQHAKPAILRSSIQKPQIFSSECPAIIYGLVNHICLFETLPNDLYNFVFSNSSYHPEQPTLAASISGALCDVKLSKSVVESQHLDTLVTREWLKISMWKLSLGWRPNSFPTSGPLLPFILPFSAGKLTMEALASVNESSRDACGIAMEQKLFDIGVCVADTALAASGSSMPVVCDNFSVGPIDLLSALLKSLANIRGAQSHLFNVLLKRSDPVLRFLSPRLLVEWPKNFESSISPGTMYSDQLGPQGTNDNYVDDINYSSELTCI
ncbi:uncharacterized protein BP5553_08637 [Venustampulla echinocandica]|uniref:Zn(2)-C6 fungal-type domain-containing protein n=1 Tax=Venustampulla echinocandica TaxID=2656787 RepID=A0A370TES6_9HELO|nr:uncharacterized protein BP5553_08637 [Venustampulla echinocandica]RDL33198.1 hypothetical protein BP5553_08637 [Venustampulla echinocandica]